MIKQKSEHYIAAEELWSYAKKAASAVECKGFIAGRAAAGRVREALAFIKDKVSSLLGINTDSKAAEWLLDNWYIAEREGKTAIFRLRYLKKVPAAKEENRAAVSKAAEILVQSGDGEVTKERLEAFLNGYQEIAVLSERELDVFIPAVVGELVVSLSSVCGMMDSEEDEKAAYFLENIFTSLRFLTNFDASELMSGVNRVERILRRDPAGIYPLMDDETRDLYRRELSDISKRAKISETDAARRVLELSRSGKERHVGHYIYREPLGKRKRQPAGLCYIGINAFFTTALSVLAGALTGSFWTAVLLFFPISEIVKNAVDFLSVRMVKPKMLPRMNFENGVPKSGKTVCVISAMLSNEKAGESLARQLEAYKLLNRDAGENLNFGILGDLPEAKKAKEEKDDRIISSAVSAIEELNEKYGGGFYLFIRDRQYSETAGVFMAPERKRGAVSDLVKFLMGKKSGLQCAAGDENGLSETNFIITLDSDTRLTAGSAKELIGAALHPLNVPVVDKKRGCVVEGCGIIQPRISVDLEAANRSDFAKIFAGAGGLDPYSTAVSDVYQDLFSKGTFTGKGLINIPVYYECLEGAFRENRVLSHDLLEGAYLNAAYMCDVEWTDGYPYKVVSYYTRLNRWTRGDWQNIQWIFPKIKNGAGNVIKNPLGAINRFKIFDNLRRSLVPVFTLLALAAGMIFSGNGFAVAGIVAALSAMSDLLASSAAVVFQHDKGAKARYHSTIISGMAGTIMRTAIRLMLLPLEAWTLLSAIVTALYRMFITKRNLLAWVTAADSERLSKNTISANYAKMAVCPILGCVLAAASPYVPATAFGLVWAFAPAYAYALSREIKEEHRIDEKDARFIYSAAGDIWRFFDEFLCPEHNFLPPDNFQEQPYAGLAPRTSPTNIGLALLSIVAAKDLNLVTDERFYYLISNVLGTIKKLPKWNGHLYNWYDTKSLNTLKPEYVSAVDSGNFAGALLTAAAALEEMGYREEAGYCRELFDGMDFSPLFDHKKKLFYIGWDISKDEPTEGWYDLLASEARQTSFIAIAKGDVPRKHWRRLGRALVSQDDFSGMASWTGTMFEYMMPNLLLPCYKNSLIYESTRFCLYVQKRSVSGMPWGISESGFYSFDPALCYRYKAHGVQKLALKRKMGEERVISPYSTFLALTVDVKSSVKNLRRLSQMGMVGKYGYFEAADFTPSRQRGGKFEIVRSYMAHHLGMSLVAVDNVLRDSVMQKRFMSDARMNAYSELLQERVPIGEVVLRQMPREVPKKLPRGEARGYLEVFEGTDALSPRCIPLSSGLYSVLLSETGHTRSVWRDMDMTRASRQVTGRMGVSFYLKTRDGMFSILPAPDFDDSVKYSGEFTGSSGRITARRGDYTASMTVSVAPEGTGELREIDISAPAGETDIGIVAVFEPVLEKRGDFEAHPAFSRLSLEAFDEEGGVIIKRRAKGKRDDVWMAFISSESAEVTTQAERGQWPEGKEFKRYSPEMRISVAVRPEIKGVSGKVRFALSPGDTREEAFENAVGILQKKRSGQESRLEAAAVMLGMKTTEVKKALSRLGDIAFDTDAGYERKSAAVKEACRRDAVWRFGISGDLPIMAAKVQGDFHIESALALIKEHALLSENGVKFDLVLILTDSGDYHAPQRRAVTDALIKLGREGSLGTFGGIHLVDSEAAGAEAVKIMAAVWVELENDGDYERRVLPIQNIRRRCVTGGEVEYRFNGDGSFTFAMRGALPKVPWSNVLANPEFGFVAADTGVGHMWYKNARERKITPWINDPYDIRGGERLELMRDGERLSLFASDDGFPTAVTFGLGYAVWEKNFGSVKTRVTAFVPGKMPCRALMIETEGAEENCRIAYFSDLVMGSENTPNPYIKTEFDGEVFSAENLKGDFGEDKFYIAPSAKPLSFTGSKTEIISGGMTGKTGVGVMPAAGFIFGMEKSLIISAGCRKEEVLSLKSEAEFKRRLEETKNWWQELTGKIKVKTPEKLLDDYINGWVTYQTVCGRLFARTSLWQSGGAFGFRDQLQDTVNVVDILPDITARQLEMAAAHQYKEGDVQHWWHPMEDGDKGVRTRCSDDLLWLPYVLAEYVEKTGDRSILQRTAPYLISPPLKKEEKDRYEKPEKGDEDTLLHHAMAAAECVMKRGLGAHGLCLMLEGDWNDGMNGVGEGGKGESVWLSWFAAVTLKKLADLCEKQNEQKEAARYRDFSERLKRAAEGTFKGQWYLRGIYDDGMPLGAPGDDECEIDSIAQSFSVFAGADKGRRESALRAALENLFDRENRIVKLFTPAFDDGAGKPGYIKAYAPGFRENGGQYTHGAIWLSMALFENGMAEEGYEVLKALLPGGRKYAQYKSEPFVLAADVYSNPDNLGRGGWTWYTGAAGWYRTLALTELLGLKVREGRLYIEPHLPKAWDGCEISYDTGAEVLDIRIGPLPARRITVNEKNYDKAGYPLKINNISISSAEKV